ncbi:DUF397 domain-containing protein [Nocardiopsis sp. N85]|uniref:DUF397 domain-containing protein n=1 Tax=Nocardiopsis sp. N85 TaxID=3029400 RepID=UPI00237FD01B|nr:DUF397 domain-containing protein [Nocardiopsis sp. N85]MDE3721869.1 DUF397 domain-containing protein [Nocardiopsis sp. N85]
MKLTYTQGRKSLPVGKRVKSERSQGATNCATALLDTTGVVEMGDTQNPDLVQLVFPAGAWTALRAAA